ncbi:MAG: class I SAM-dependent methyltransferase [Anaerolineales bacterium]
MSSAPFDAVAQRYAERVAPRFQEPASDLVELAQLQPGERVLDLGTGPGTAALIAARRVLPDGALVGVDQSAAMLEIARTNANDAGLAIEFLQADIETIDLASGPFDVALSSFGLGRTDPAKSLPAIRKLLRPGGRLVLSQWGPGSQAAGLFFDLLRKRRTNQPAPELEEMRSADLMARAWYSEFNTPQAISDLLGRHGFRDVQAEMRTYKFQYENSNAYLEMSLSFPLAHAEFAALSPGSQRMFQHEFNALTAPLRGPKRSVISEDTVLFAAAYLEPADL